jgi:ABC-type nitrate/sulfonate/bicarbonate transport system substrate-binding protein
MQHIRVAYRDYDRTPVIYAIQEMARRHYDLDVEVLRIPGTQEYEAALFVGACDVAIEHLEYFFGQRPGQGRVTMFCAPVVESEQHLVVRPEVNSPADLEGQTFAVRPQGRFHTVALRIRAMGLEGKVGQVKVPDSEVGRWGQWKKVLSGECRGAFMSPLYLPAPLEAGLKVLPTAKLPQVEHYGQVCLTSFAQAQSELMTAYMKAMIHALCVLKLQREEALQIVNGEPKRLIALSDQAELERWFDHIVQDLQVRPYPTLEAIANSYEAAVVEYPEVAGFNPLACWDLHWLKALDDAGFIDGLLAQMA